MAKTQGKKAQEQPVEVRVKHVVKLDTGTVLRPGMRVWLKPHMIEALGGAVERV